MFTWSLFRLYALHVSYAIVHVLRSLKPSHQLLKLIDIYGMELDLTVLLLFFFLYMLYFSSLSPLFLVFLECWVSCLGWLSESGCLWESSGRSNRFSCGRSQWSELYWSNLLQPSVARSFEEMPFVLSSIRVFKEMVSKCQIKFQF